MKTHFEKLIKKAGHQNGLSDIEREKMRFVLQEYIAFKPILIESAKPVSMTFIQLFLVRIRPLVAVPIAATLILLLTGGGMAYASEKTLPGDALYGVKINVLEPIGTAFTFSPEKKVIRHMALAERRAEEGATLAHQGRLSTSTEQSLTKEFTRHARAATETLSRLSVSEKRSADASVTHVNARLVQDEEVFAQSASTTQNTHARTFQKTLHSYLSSLVSTSTGMTSAPLLPHFPKKDQPPSTHKTAPFILPRSSSTTPLSDTEASTSQKSEVEIRSSGGGAGVSAGNNTGTSISAPSIPHVPSVPSLGR